MKIILSQAIQSLNRPRAWLNFEQQSMNDTKFKICPLNLGTILANALQKALYCTNLAASSAAVGTSCANPALIPIGTSTMRPDDGHVKQARPSQLSWPYSNGGPCVPIGSTYIDLHHASCDPTLQESR